MAKQTKKIKKEVRRKRVRAKIKGTAKRPRLSIFKSNKHFYIQLIDDSAGKTLASVSDKGRIISPYELGKSLAGKTAAFGVKEIVFDRSGYKFHGAVSQIAAGVREGGLKF